MTPKQEAFAMAVAGGSKLVDAYRTFYACAKSSKNTLYKRSLELSISPAVAARIKELQDIAAEKSVLNAAEILNELNRLAMSTPKSVYWPDGKVMLPHELDAATAASVKGFKIDEFGRMEYTFHDKRGAIDMAMKHLGLYERDNSQKPAEIREIRLVGLQPAKEQDDDT